MVKICIFHLGFYFSGGGEKLVVEEMQGLTKLGFEVKCFSPIVDKQRCFPDVIKKLPIYPIFPQLPLWFPKRETLQILFTCLFFPLVAWRFRKYDLIIGANQPGPYFGFIVKTFFGIPYIAYLAQPLRLLHPRSIDRKTGLFIRHKLAIFPYLTRIFSFYIDWADRKGTQKADRILVNGIYAQKMIEKTYSVKALNCPAGCYPVNRIVGVDSRFQGNLRASSKRITKPYILVSNRHFPQKKFEYIISSLPKISQKGGVIRLVITGEEMPYTEVLRKLVADLDLQKQVIFTGLVPERELLQLYKNASVYVYSAPEEDFGMGIIEALACGTPVVAWNQAGPAYIIKDNKGGLLAKSGDLTDFANCIQKLVKNKRLLSQKSKEAIKLAREFTYTRHNHFIKKQIEEVIYKKG